MKFPAKGDFTGNIAKPLFGIARNTSHSLPVLGRFLFPSTTKRHQILRRYQMTRIFDY